MTILKIDNESNFEFALRYTFNDEGGLVNNKNDKGGVTNMGITLYTLKAAGYVNPSEADIKNLTKTEASRIYKSLYWDSLSLDLIKHCGVATAIFNIGVVCGTGTSKKYAKEIAGGYLNNINSIEAGEFISKFSQRAIEGFNNIVEKNPAQQVFLNGWINRAKRLLSLIEVA